MSAIYNLVNFYCFADSTLPCQLTCCSVLQYHQVNALFVEAQQFTTLGDGKHLSNATHIGSMGLKLYNMTVQVDVTVNGSMTGTFLPLLP